MYLVLCTKHIRTSVAFCKRTKRHREEEEKQEIVSKVSSEIEGNKQSRNMITLGETQPSMNVGPPNIVHCLGEHK